MERGQRENRKHGVNPEQKYIRLQVIGMSFWLSILPAMMLAYMFNLDTFVGQIATLLAVVGGVFFSFGLMGRQELKEQGEQEADSKVKRI